MTSGAARTQPMRIPAQNALLAEPTVITVDPPGSKPHTGRGIRTSSSRSSLMVSSATSTVPAERAASTRRRRWSSSASAPVGLWKSATTYAMPRRGVAQDLPPAVHVPAGQTVGHRDGHQPGPRLAHELEDVGVGGRLDGDALAASAEEMADGVDGAHRAGGDHDLLGHRRDPARGVALGDHRAQRGQAGRIVAVRVGVRRQLLQRALYGTGEPRFGRGQGGAAQVDHGTERSRGAAAQGLGPGAGCPPARRSSCRRRAGTPGNPRRAAPRRRRRRSYGSRRGRGRVPVRRAGGRRRGPGLRAPAAGRRRRARGRRAGRRAPGPAGRSCWDLSSRASCAAPTAEVHCAMITSPPSPNWPWMTCASKPQSVTSQATATTRGTPCPSRHRGSRPRRNRRPRGSRTAMSPAGCSSSTSASLSTAPAPPCSCRPAWAWSRGTCCTRVSPS